MSPEQNLPGKCTRGYWELWEKLLSTFRDVEKAHQEWVNMKVWRSPEGKFYTEEAALNILKSRVSKSTSPSVPSSEETKEKES